MEINTLEGEQGPTLLINWLNGGKTPAWHLVCAAGLVLGEKPTGAGYFDNKNFFDDFYDVAASFLPPEKEVRVSYRVNDFKATKEVLADINSGRTRLYASVHAIYIDFKQTTRLFHAAALYNPQSRTFGDYYDYDEDERPN
jgi:hypothetical protein